MIAYQYKISIFKSNSVRGVLFVMFFLFSVAENSHGQISVNEDTVRQCYTEFMSQKLKAKFSPFPSYALQSESASEATYYVIPVVVHVIHMGGPENISDELIKSQIDVLNEDYGHFGSTNTDPRGADTRIRFCLAKIDPWGNPTTGINRIFSERTDLISDDEIATKGLSTWDPKKYLNFWIVRTIDGSSNIQAYSFLPSNSGGPKYEGDGVVVLYKFFGKGGNFSTFYNLGKTSSHESGHYFNLLHTWGRDLPGYGGCNDDDGVDDTPVCSLEYYASPLNNCNHPVQCGNVRMIENYLDYSTDACLTLFTRGQANRMIAAINQYRPDLVNPQNLAHCGCRDLYDSLNNVININLSPTIVGNNKLYLIIKNNFTEPLTFNIYDIYGRILYTAEYENIGTQTIEINLNEINFTLRPGVYVLRGSYAGTFQRKFVIAAQ